MNSCILMAQIVSNPELRSTQDQTSVSTMIVEFESSREGDPPGTVQVEGWGNLAEEMKQSYSSGDQVIIEGRLSMNLIERDGYKEKKAKLVASRIYSMGTSPSSDTASSYTAESFPTQQPNNVVDFAPSPSPTPVYDTPAPATEPAPTSTSGNNEDWDEIPFLRPVYSRTNFGMQLFDSWELEANRYWDGVKQFID